jgi:hypothetical protein
MNGKRRDQRSQWWQPKLKKLKNINKNQALKWNSKKSVLFVNKLLFMLFFIIIKIKIMKKVNIFKL